MISAIQKFSIQVCTLDYLYLKFYKRKYTIKFPRKHCKQQAPYKSRKREPELMSVFENFASLCALWNTRTSWMLDSPTLSGSPLPYLRTNAEDIIKYMPIIREQISRIRTPNTCLHEISGLTSPFAYLQNTSWRRIIALITRHEKSPNEIHQCVFNNSPPFLIIALARSTRIGRDSLNAHHKPLFVNVIKNSPIWMIRLLFRTPQARMLYREPPVYYLV